MRLPVPSRASVRFSPRVLEFARDVVLGLTDTPRWLPCKYLYDARGSELFESITAQPEYYPTRTEASLLERYAPEIPEITGPVSLIELGSGSSAKTDHVLRAYEGTQPVEYVPVDVSGAAIAQASDRLEREFPHVQVHGVVGTYEDAFPLIKDYSPAMVMFLGSTLGNFNQTESLFFWQRVSHGLQAGDYFLLGVDLVKDRVVLEAAYNDAAGATAEFTTNLFARINRELGASVDLDALEHVAQYNETWQRMEIFTRFHRAQRVRVDPLNVDLEVAAGEQIMIEISRKFKMTNLRNFLSCFDLETVATFTDDRQWFGELLVRKKESDHGN
jgi:L-histidine Nalpha-methyltransferase